MIHKYSLTASTNIFTVSKWVLLSRTSYLLFIIVLVNSIFIHFLSYWVWAIQSMTIAAVRYALESKAFTGASIILTTIFSCSYLAIAVNEFQDGRWSYWLSRAKWPKSRCEFQPLSLGSKDWLSSISQSRYYKKALRECCTAAPAVGGGAAFRAWAHLWP